jgi:hypothetical protein
VPNEGQTIQTPPADGDGNAAPPASGALDLTPDLVRSTPEYQELQRQNRILARENGQAKAQAAAARTQAEATAQAAEAERTAAQANRVREILGEDGLAMWDQFADLSSTDPVKAAELLAEYTKGKAQSHPAVPQAPAPAAAAGGNIMAGTQPATGLSRSVGTAPLAGQSDDPAETIAALEKRYADVVERNQDSSLRNRVTMKDRASAMISYLGAAYLKAGAKPK